jgi:AP-1 complex subunit beta-1
MSRVQRFRNQEAGNHLIIQVYLFVINYSRTRPDDAIMVINLFRKDALNKANPIVRALAVRTMSSLRVAKLSEYVVEVVKQALNDSEPYVRKTAVLAVPKIYEISKDDPETIHLIETLQEFISKEPNSLVLANTVSSLVEIGTHMNR